MPISQDYIAEIKKDLDKNKPKFDLANDLLDIVDGQLMEYVLACLKQQFSDQAYQTAKLRLSPINMLIKIIDKLTPIYKPAPRRTVMDGTDDDSELLSFYETTMNVNTKMLWATKNVVLNKGAFIMPFIHKGLPRLRILTKDHFLVRGTDKQDKLYPTELITFDCYNSQKMGFVYYSADEIAVVNEDNKVDYQAMETEGVDAKNPLGVLPGVYWNHSESSIFPMPSEDMMHMTTLVPILLTDLNYAQMFQCFSIFYTINMDKQTQMRIAPNAVLQLEVDRTIDNGGAQIGTLQPSVDTSGALSSIHSQISMWLNSHGIKPGSIGQLSQDSFASGISKLVDEMDTLELRQSLVQEATVIEEQLWFYIVKIFHPWAKASGLLPDAKDFSPDCYIEVNFSEQMPLNGRGQLVKDLALEVTEGFTTKARAIKVLNPQMTDGEIEDLQEEIKFGDQVVIDEDLSDQNNTDLSNVNTLPDATGNQTTAPQISLNGAQVTSMVEIVQSVAAGTLPRDSGLNMLRVAFALSDQDAEAILGESGKSFKIEVSELNGNSTKMASS